MISCYPTARSSQAIAVAVAVVTSSEEHGMSLDPSVTSRPEDTEMGLWGIVRKVIPGQL